jgi:hypothetical protein
MIFTSLYTPHTGYEVEARRLEASLERFDLPHYIEAVPSRGSWLKNVHEIPRHCLRMLDRFRCPIVYLDADATVERVPELFYRLDREGVDFAVHHCAPWVDNYGGDPRGELLDGTMFLRDSDRARDLLRRWIEADDKRPNCFEQRVLEENLVEWARDLSLRYHELPAEYCTIFDHPRQRARMNGTEPVVLHHQASRRLRDSLIPGEWQYTEDLLAALKEPIAVVGNGACFGESDGDEIDAHASVVRLNNYRLDGFERIVGTKTTAWGINAWYDVRYKPRGLPVFTPHHLDDHEGRVREWKDLNRCPHLLSAFESVERLFLPIVRRPSTGLAVLGMLERMGKKTRAYGFDGMKTGHYWAEGDPRGHSDPEAEVLRKFAFVCFPGVRL